MKLYISTVMALMIGLNAVAQYRPDILGDGFEQLTIELQPDYSGEICATLVRHTPLVESSSAVLYIHGYNDYFFQREMAERFVDSRYNFYALDLRKYGRSHRTGQTLFEVREMSEYFEEIDAAIEQIRSEGMKHIVLMSHSTGGLTTSLYCAARGADVGVDAMILNSPFLDMNLGEFTETLLVPMVSAVGAILPDWVIFQSESSCYFESLDSSHHGEWSYDTTLKLPNMNPTTAGWIRAIHRGQMALQRGVEIEIPILLMYSDRSAGGSEWSPEFQYCDTVLDVADIAKYGSQLGENVTHAEIAGGVHDLILSSPDVRERAYNTIFGWLERINLESCSGSCTCPSTDSATSF
ncbi:MAG: alpha/beta hydrolase [Rikenellaceae bacterium]